MALISCPECDEQASDRARACPHCGFPIAAEIERNLAEVSGVARVRTARQIAARDKLKTWSERYEDHPRSVGKDQPANFFERYQRLILVVVVALVVSLQLFILMSAA